jgi:hypothetical protein
MPRSIARFALTGSTNAENTWRRVPKAGDLGILKTLELRPTQLVGRHDRGQGQRD